MNTPILTIAIPTFNRESELEKCLEYICPQLNSEVKLVVRDNCSNYNIEKLIKKFSNYNITLYRNKINIGGDANIAHIFEYCDTDWLWVLGDDDYICDNAITQALNTIKKNQEVIYIKFNAPIQIKVKGLSGFLDAMKPKSAFANSYFISECVYRIKGCEKDIFWQYKYLSIYIGQIMRIIKHLLVYPNDECLFLKTKILDFHSLNISWNQADVIICQSLIFEIFFNQRKIFKDNIFKDYIRYSLTLLDISNLSLKKKIYYYGLLAYKAGIFNVIRYNYAQVLRIPLRKLCSKKLYNNIKNFISIHCKSSM